MMQRMNSLPYKTPRGRCTPRWVLAILCWSALCLPASAQKFWPSEHQTAVEWVRWSLEEIHGPRVRAAKDFARCSWVRGQGRDHYGLRMHEPCASVDAATPLVILVHGLNASHDLTWRHLPPPTPCERWSGSFAYPTSQSLGASAGLLSCALPLLRKEAAARPTVLVTHSMGGLGARAAIEDPELNPGGVTRLI